MKTAIRKIYEKGKKKWHGNLNDAKRFKKKTMEMEKLMKRSDQDVKGEKCNMGKRDEEKKRGI